jgi:amino acid adenylation domain-containing protein
LQVAQIESSAFEWSPLAKIQSEWSSLPKGTSLFDTMLVYENYPIDSSRTSDEDALLVVKDADSVESPSIPLTVAVSLGEDQRLHTMMLYDTGRFASSDTVSAVSAHLAAALRALVSAPAGSTVAQLSLTEADELSVLNSWNIKQSAFPDSLSFGIHTMFEQRVSETPDSVVTTYVDEQLTYAELNRRANVLAHFLIKCGVKPQDRVALSMYRSIELHVAMIAIWKAGASYLPIEPTYPPARQRLMVEDSSSVMVLTQQSIKDRYDFAPHVCVDSAWQAICASMAGQPQATENPNIPFDNLTIAYIIYTSGSTGKPKGVMVPHAGVIARTADWIKRYGLTALDRHMQRTSLCFDFTVIEIMSPLISGGTVVFLPSKEEREISTIVSVASEQHATVVCVVPSMLDAILSSDNVVERWQTVRRLFIGGEAVPEHIQPLFFAGFWSNKFVNLYGPTETTMGVTSWSTTDPTCGPNFSIGSRFHNVRAYIVNQNLEPVPIGVAGELLLGGLGIAQGYLDRPSLTADRFIPNPFVENISDIGRTLCDARLYRTGDLCRFTPEGNIVYTGRLDFQARTTIGERRNMYATDPFVVYELYRSRFEVSVSNWAKLNLQSTASLA